MPWSDWQFWVVSAVALVAIFIFARTLLPRRKPRVRRTSLTISADRTPRDHRVD